MNVKVTPKTYKSGTPYWYVSGTRPDGERVREFHPNKATAELRAEVLRRESLEAMLIPEPLKFEAAACDKLLQPHEWTIRKATDYVLKHVIPFEKKPTVAKAVEEYLNCLFESDQPKSSKSTAKSRLGMMSHKFGVWRTNELTKDDFVNWKTELFREGYAPTGVRHFLSYASGFFTWAIQQGYCEKNVLAEVEWPEVKYNKPVVFALDQVRLLFEIAPKYGLLARSVIGTLGAVRPSEMALLDMEAVNLDERIIRVEHDTFSPQECRIIELEGEWGDAAVAWLKLCPRTGPMSPPMDSTRVKALYKEMNCWSHDIMRHTGASAHYAFFKNIEKTKYMLGHSARSDVFHKHYKALMTKAQAAAIYALRPS